MCSRRGYWSRDVFLDREWLQFERCVFHAHLESHEEDDLSPQRLVVQPTHWKKVYILMLYLLSRQESIVRLSWLYRDTAFSQAATLSPKQTSVNRTNLNLGLGSSTLSSPPRPDHDDMQQVSNFDMFSFETRLVVL